MLVEAIRLGYYGNKRVRQGQMFNLKSKDEFSKEWMKEVGGKKEAKAAKTDKVIVDFDQDQEEIVI